MKKTLALLLAGLMLISLVACKSDDNSKTTTTAAVTTPAATTTKKPSVPKDPAFTGEINTDKWEVESGVDYSKYEFLGRGEELLKDVAENYKGYSVTYTMDGRSTNAGALNSVINVMADYKVDKANKKLTVNIDTIDVRVQFDYTSLKSKSGNFIVVSFTTNLPTMFMASIGANRNLRGEICQEGILPEGKNGTYTGHVKLTVPYVNEGRYYLNLSIDSGNAGYPFMTSIPIDIEKGEFSDNPYKLLYAGDWDLIKKKEYQANLTKLFYNSYARLYARWGTGSEPKTITFVADKNYDGVAYASGTQVVVSVDYANSNPKDLGFFSHEITHSVQQYGNKMKYGDTAWWTENLANYGGFRYFHWSDAEYIQLYQATDTSLQDWGYQAYGNNKWFFSYMDARYPTSKNEDGTWNYGLIDSINFLIKNHRGAQLTDDPYDPSTPFNQTVKKITGFDCMEDLRKYYVQELKTGTWDFKGFGGWPDNFITENVPGAENPIYPVITDPLHGDKTAPAMDAITGSDNLALDTEIWGSSGNLVRLQANRIIDGKTNTTWKSNSIINNYYSLDGCDHWVCIDLGELKTFDTYTLISGDEKSPVVEWGLFVSTDRREWTAVDYQNKNTNASASYNIGEQTARYVLLRVYTASKSGNDLAIAELGLYKKG